MRRNRQLAVLEDFANWLSDGFSPRQACLAMQAHAERYQLVSEARLARSMLSGLHRGEALVSALRRHLDSDLCMVFAIGQEVGQLAPMLTQYQLLEQQQQQARQTFMRPLFYPLGLLLFSWLALYGVGHFILPQLAAGLAPSEWPALSFWVYQLGQAPVIGGGMLVLLLVWLGGYGPQWMLAWGASFWQRYPRATGAVIGRSFAAVIWLQQLALLLQYGCNLDRAAQLLEPHAPRWMAPHLWRLRVQLTQGERRLSVLLDTGLLSRRMLYRLENAGVASRKAQEAEPLVRCASRAQADAELSLTRARWTIQFVSYALVVLILLLLVAGLGQLLMQISTALF